MTYAIDSGTTGSNSGSASGGTAYTMPSYYPDGSVTYPSLAFANDIHKGVYATNLGVGIATGSTGRLFVDNSGNVGVSQNLTVAGAAAITGTITLGAGAGIYNTTQPTPNGYVTAAPGSVAFSSTGGANATLWIKEAGFDNQGWTNVTRPTLTAMCASGMLVGSCVSLSEASGGYTATLVSVTNLQAVPAVGVVQSVMGQSCVVCLSGIAPSIAMYMVPNAPMYVGQNGQITTDTTQFTAPYYLQSMGRAVSATDGVLNVGDVSLYRS